jgi:two-component system response regulator ChvI
MIPCRTCPYRRIGSSRLVLNEDCRRAHWQGVDVGLSVGEYRVLAALVGESGQYITFQRLYDIMRQRTGFHVASYRNNVRSAIKRIRRKFVTLDPSFAAIKTYSSFGYKWDETP